MNCREANVCTIRVVVHGTQIVVSFEKVPGHNSFKLSPKIYTFLWFVFLKVYANYLFAVRVMRISGVEASLKCIQELLAESWFTGSTYIGQLLIQI